jgi:hypothetical protein
MSKPSELETNLSALDLALAPALLAEAAQIVEPVKDFLWPSGRPENQDA